MMFARFAALSLSSLLAVSAHGQILPEVPVPDTEPTNQGGAVGGASSGTALEPFEASYMRGLADVVRSRGVATLQSSQALKNVEEARRTYIDSRLSATQNYYDIKRMNDDYRASKRPEPLSFESYVRLARAQAPERLSVSQLDPFSGAIYWPAALNAPAYAEHRSRIQNLYVQRANDLASNKREIQVACDNLLASLKAELATFAQTDYIQAVRFVEGLRYEAVVARN